MSATVTVYSKPACVQCKATYRALEKAGISYVVVDLTQAPDALEYIMEDLGYSQAPVIIVNDDEQNHWSGFRPDHITTLADVLKKKELSV